ncbi:MAG: acyltransferase [Rhodobacteraceae bacterium]|nr:acyltransferase [Paracoccaceae bacterium]
MTRAADSHAPNNFDFVRLVAAAWVIVGHGYHLNGLYDTTPLLFNTAISTFAVRVFFVVSGYLVVASWRRDPHVGRFLARRALRIWPGLCGVVLIAAFVLGPVMTTLDVATYFSDPQTYGYLGTIFFYIQYYLPGVFAANVYPVAVNGSLWSLPAEVAMYLSVPAVALMGMALPFRYAYALGAKAVVAVAAIVPFVGSQPPVPVIVWATDLIEILWMAPYFVVGGCLDLFRRYVPLHLGAAAVLVVIGEAISAAGPSVQILLVLITCYAVISFGTSSTPYIRRAARFGDLSYGIFLYGYPIQQIIAGAWHADLPVPFQIALALVLAAACAFLSWRFIERPSLNLKPRTPRSAPSSATTAGRSD